MKVSGLSTPALIVDVNILKANMQDRFQSSRTISSMSRY